MRYEVRVIDSGKFGEVLLSSDDATKAKEFADSGVAYEHYYGVAIIDTETDTVDLGDRTVAVAAAFRE